MDSFADISKKSFHTRSNSLPLRPHPVVDDVDEHLCRLKASAATSSSSSLSQKLGKVQDLHDSIDNLLLLPLTHQAVVDNDSVDDLLEGSLELVDLCSMAKDVLSQMKECTHELQFVLRRRRGDDITNDVQKYLNSRKIMKKTIHKALKGMEKSSSKTSDESSDIVTLLKQAEAITYSTIESLLSFMAGPKSVSKASRWSMVSKLMQPKRVACKEEGSNTNLVEMVDATLSSIKSHKSNVLLQVEDVQNLVRELDSSVDELEDDLERLYRRLIKNRVSFLNILNH